MQLFVVGGMVVRLQGRPAGQKLGSGVQSNQESGRSTVRLVGCRFNKDGAVQVQNGQWGAVQPGVLLRSPVPSGGHAINPPRHPCIWKAGSTQPCFARPLFHMAAPGSKRLQEKSAPCTHRGSLL